MKKFIILPLIIGGCFAQGFAEEVETPNIHSSNTYITTGIGPLPLPFPLIGVGRRNVVSDRMAIDFGVSGSTLIHVHMAKAHLNSLWYMKQTPVSQWYAGVGASVGAIAWDHSVKGYFAPNFVVGKEFFNSNCQKRFFQVETMYPMVSMHHTKVVNFPFISLKYGFAF